MEIDDERNNEYSRVEFRDKTRNLGDFKHDLGFALECENQVANMLESKYGIKTLQFNNDNKFDLLCENQKGDKFTIEIKEDFMCERTGNIGLEYSCRGRPSGISVSQADYYLYKAHEPSGEINFYIIETYKLKKMIDNLEYHRTVNGGDPGSNSLNFLFALDVVQRNFRRL
jgi:hypothetical protein